MTDTTITNEQIEALRREADAAGDDPMVHCCWVALGKREPGQGGQLCPSSQDEARAECARVIAAAAAMED